MAEQLNRTALYDAHVSLGARMVPFAGWEMPIQYQGILAEARSVRSSTGIFDVSHMGRIWVTGPDAAALLDWVVTADVPALALNRARYTLVCTPDGGILDDGIVYRLGDDEHLLVCNASNRAEVWDWLLRWRDDRFPHAHMEDRTLDVGMIAFQGPGATVAMESLAPTMAQSPRPFRCVQTHVAGVAALVARTGYTGEDGFEIMPAVGESVALWRSLMDSGAVPCGLGARDVLRLEAGLLLHGNDMTRDTNPFEAGLDRFVATTKTSVSSAALDQVLKQGIQRKIAGFRMLDRGVPRHGYAILNDGVAVGEVTSGGYSPTLDSYIGLGYVSIALATPGSRLTVDVRGKKLEAEVVELPFYTRRRD
jgi:aminomethyltransferase